MRWFRAQKGWLLTVVLVAVLACNLPQGNSPTGGPVASPPSGGGAGLQETAVPPAALTMAAGTAIAAMTQTAAAFLAAAPTGTPTPSPTLSPTPTLTLTPTPSTPMISVSVNTNCRTGPGDAYDRVGALLVGETAEVLARDPYGQFWYIPNPDRPGSKCWVWGQYATVTGDTSSLPVFTPPPTPTPAANFAITGLGHVVCGGAHWYALQVKNTGGLTWESWKEEVVDLTTSAAATYTGDGFAAAFRCVSLVVPTLPAGQTAYVGNFASTPGHHVRITLTLYTDTHQRGQAVTYTAEYNLP